LAFAAEVATCTVGADLNVIVPGPPAHDLASALRRFADLKASSPARIYKVSEASVRRALDGGMQASEIMSVLERHSTTDIPQNVAYLIEDVARRHGHLVVGRVGLYLRSDDPSLLRAAVADRRLTSMRPRVIAPTVAVLEANDVEVLLTALRMAGYLPVAEAGGGALRAGAGREPVGDSAMHRLLRPSEPELGLSQDEAASLASTLRRGPGAVAPGASSSGNGGRPADPAQVRLPGLATGLAGLRDLRLLDGRNADTAGDIQQLMELAIDHWMVVEIMYVSQDGKPSTREIEPLEVSRVGVDAWCRLRQDERHFLLPRIKWARATGERFGELPDDEDAVNGPAGEESLDRR
jgi:hypothetical protein